MTALNRVEEALKITNDDDIIEAWAIGPSGGCESTHGDKNLTENASTLPTKSSHEQEFIQGPSAKLGQTDDGWRGEIFHTDDGAR